MARFKTSVEKKTKMAASRAQQLQQEQEDSIDLRSPFSYSLPPVLALPALTTGEIIYDGRNPSVDMKKPSLQVKLANRKGTNFMLVGTFRIFHEQRQGGIDNEIHGHSVLNTCEAAWTKMHNSKQKVAE
ncbi:conserved hypothetical protein [Ricinus communis]|uniref:Uncharacterized protein n=1 Tax=Ricinus communis TaxID=3988 RepID=B9RJF5_RICCO|nr:conserved hypothetical protein [Ricinus communis]